MADVPSRIGLLPDAPDLRRRKLPDRNIAIQRGLLPERVSALHFAVHGSAVESEGEQGHSQPARRDRRSTVSRRRGGLRGRGRADSLREPIAQSLPGSRDPRRDHRSPDRRRPVHVEPGSVDAVREAAGDRRFRVVAHDACAVEQRGALQRGSCVRLVRRAVSHLPRARVPLRPADGSARARPGRRQPCCSSLSSTCRRCCSWTPTRRPLPGPAATGIARPTPSWCSAPSRASWTP